MAKIINPSKLLPSAKSTSIVRISKDNISPFVKPVKNNVISSIIKKSQTSIQGKENNNRNKQDIEEVNVKLLEIKTFLNNDLLSSKKKTETKRKKKEKEDFEEAEKKLETPQSKKFKLPGVSLPSIGLFDRIKRFIFFTALGWLVPKLIEFLPKLEGIFKIIGSVYKFAETLFGKLFDGFMSLVKFGGDLKDKTLGFIAQLKVGPGGDYEGEFKKLEKQFDTFVNVSILAGVLSADIGLAAVDEYNKWRKKNEVSKGVTGGKLAGKIGLRDVGKELGERKPGYQDPGRYRAKGQARAGGFALEQARKKAPTPKPSKPPSWWQKITGGLKSKVGKLAKPFSKFAGAAVPGLGAAIGFADASARSKSGDKLGAFLAGLSASLDAFTAAVAVAGLATAATGVGLPAAGVLGGIAGAAGIISMSIDAVLLIRDILKTFGVPVFNKGGRVVRKYQGGGTTRGGRPVSGPARRTIAPTRRRKPIKIKPPKSQPGKDVGGEKKIREFYGKELKPGDQGYFDRPAGGWLASLGQKRLNEKPLKALTTTSKILKEIPLVGGIMGAAVDIALGQKPDQKIYNSLSSGIGYLVESLTNQRVNMSMTSLMRDIKGFAEGGKVPPSRELKGTYGSLSSGDLVAKVLGPTIDQRVNEAIKSIEKEMQKIQEKKEGGTTPPEQRPGGGGGDYGPIEYGPLPLSMTEKQAFATVYELAKKHGAAMPELVAAMAMYESGYLKSELARNANNPFGQTGKGNKGSYTYKGRSWAVYNSLEDAVKWHVENWNNNSKHGRGLGTYESPVEGLKQGLPIYAPASDGNNHKNYIRAVSSILSTMGFDPNKKNKSADLSTEQLIQQRKPTASGIIPGRPELRTGSFASGLYIGSPGDNDGQQTGLNMNLPGGIGTPIYAPFDMIYRTKGTDGNPSVGLQGTPDALGPSGRGFGYYGAYYFRRGDREYEVLMGHFKGLPFRGKKDGEIIPKGTLLGYQGASGRSVSSTGGVYPHISLHVNGVGFRARNEDLVEFANALAGDKLEKPKSYKLAIKNGKEGIIEDGKWKPKKWTAEEKQRYSKANPQAAKSQKPQQSQNQSWLNNLNPSNWFNAKSKEEKTSGVPKSAIAVLASDGKTYYADIQGNKVYDEKGAIIKITRDKNTWLLKDIANAIRARKSQAQNMQGGGLIQPQKSRLPIPNSFASYESPGSGMMIAVQPIIIEKSIPTPSTKNPIIDFIPIGVNNNNRNSLSVG